MWLLWPLGVGRGRRALPSRWKPCVGPTTQLTWWVCAVQCPLLFAALQLGGELMSKSNLWSRLTGQGPCCILRGSSPLFLWEVFEWACFLQTRQVKRRSHLSRTVSSWARFRTQVLWWQKYAQNPLCGCASGAAQSLGQEGDRYGLRDIQPSYCRPS